MIKRKIVNVVLLNIAFASAHLYADSALYKPCAVCHGDKAEGNAALSAPRLAGQNAAYITEQLHNFRSGKRGIHADDVLGQMMAESVKKINDQDIQRLGVFLAKLPEEKVDSTEGDIQRGRQIYADNCLACHGVDGRGVTPLYTANLRILSAAYIERQLEAYRNGWRGDHEWGTTRSKGMRAIVSQLKDESEIADLLAYLTH